MKKDPRFDAVYAAVFEDVKAKTKDVEERLESASEELRKNELKAKNSVHQRMRNRLKAVQLEMDEVAKAEGLTRGAVSVGLEDAGSPYLGYFLGGIRESYERRMNFARTVKREATKAALKISKDPDLYDSSVSDAVSKIRKEFE